MLNKEELKEKLRISFDKDLNFFIERIEALLKQKIAVHGLNLSIYLLKNKMNEKREKVYEVFSFDYSQDKDYYDNIWQKYLEVHTNKFSHFDFDPHNINGWYDFVEGPVQLPKFSTNNFKDLQKIKERLPVESEKAFYNAVFYERAFNNTNFIAVNKGWQAYIGSLEKYGFIKKFNLSWISSYLHNPISESFDYPSWYISSYLLLNIGESIKDKGTYKKAIRPNINKLLFSTSISLHEILIAEKQNELINQAIKSAETKILSRNFSHHIGSHVMPNVSLKQIRARYKELCDKDISDEYLDFLKTKLDNYITERNEFLCDPDGSLKSVLFQCQIIIPFIENFLITDNLCQSEGLGFRKNNGCDIEIEVKINGCKNIIKSGSNEYPKLPYDGLNGKDSYGEFQAVSTTITGIDLPIAVSNVHVIFSILENFIRNTAKHQKEYFTLNDKTHSLRETLKVFLDLEQDKDDQHSFWLTISDNVSIVREGFELNDPEIINENYEVSQSCLGIIDFKICAGLLNKKSFKQVDKSIFKINRDQAGKLSYCFKILKPKDICLIGYANNRNVDHQTFDCYPTVNDFMKSNRPPVPYQFYLIKETVFGKLLETPENRKTLPFRLLVEKCDSEIKFHSEYFQPETYGRKYLFAEPIDLSKKTDEILGQCWYHWLKRWGNKKELVVYSEEKLDGWDNVDFNTEILKFQYACGTVKKIESLSIDYPKVFYDHHGGGLSNSSFPTERSFLSSNAYIPFGKNSKDIAFIRNSKPQQNKKWLLPFQLTEAGLSKILILDERIIDIASGTYQNKKSKNTLIDYGGFAYRKYTSDFTRWEEQNRHIHNIDSYWASNIFVISHLNGNPIKESLFSGNSLHWIKVKVNKTLLSIQTNFDYLSYSDCEITDYDNIVSLTDFDAIIIHRTFLNDQSLKTFWGGKTSKEVLEILNDHFPLVLITSGGGDVITYEGNFKFISFNEVLKYLSVPESIGKQALTNIMFTK